MSKSASLPRSASHSPARALASLAVLWLGACASFEKGRDVPATPQRPTFSTDTSTTAEGTLELEAGFAVDPSDRFGTPTALKYGIDARAEAYVGFEPLIVLDESGVDEKGIGDLTLGYRRRVADADAKRPAVAVLGAVKLPTADEDDGLGSGETDVFGAVAATLPGTTWTTTAYAQLGLLGDPSGGTALQTAVSLATGRALDMGLSGYGEIAILLTPEFDDEQLITTLGVAKAFTPGRVVDLGFAVGLGDDAPDFQLLLGTTLNFGRLR